MVAALRSSVKSVRKNDLEPFKLSAFIYRFSLSKQSHLISINQESHANAPQKKLPVGAFHIADHLSIRVDALLMRKLRIPFLTTEPS